MFFLVIRNSSNKRRIGGAALIRGRRLLTFFFPDSALNRGRRLFIRRTAGTAGVSNKFKHLKAANFQLQLRKILR